MTAILAIRRPDRLTMFSDTAVLNDAEPDCAVLRFQSKVWRLPNRAIAIGRGEARIAPWFALQAEQLGWGDLDAAVERYADILDLLHFMAAKKYGTSIDADDQWQKSEIFVGGWSAKRDRPETWVGSWNDRAMRTTGALYAAGLLETDDPAALARTAGNEEAGGKAFFDAFRRDCIVHRGFCWVGGTLQMTTLTSRGVETHDIHTWPDKVGEPIKPEETGYVASASAAA